MEIVHFTAAEKAIIVAKLQEYLGDALNYELEQFDGEFLLNFIAEHIGKYFYNRGILDAQAKLAKRIDEIRESIAELEIPISD